MLAQLERTDEAQISLTDPDSRAMAAHTKVAVGYNIQVAVDAKNKLIVEQAVTNQVVDMGLLAETAEPAREILDVETIDVVADRGYFKAEDIEACEKAGCIPHVPRPQRGSSVREGFFRKDEFRYDVGRDAYVCPAGTLLTPIRHGRLRDLAKVDYGNRGACRDCWRVQSSDRYSGYRLLRRGLRLERRGQTPVLATRTDQVCVEIATGTRESARRRAPSRGRREVRQGI